MWSTTTTTGPSLTAHLKPPGVQPKPLPGDGSSSSRAAHSMGCRDQPTISNGPAVLAGLAPPSTPQAHFTSLGVAGGSRTSHAILPREQPPENPNINGLAKYNQSNTIQTSRHTAEETTQPQDDTSETPGTPALEDVEEWLQPFLKHAPVTGFPIVQFVVPDCSTAPPARPAQPECEWGPLGDWFDFEEYRMSWTLYRPVTYQDMMEARRESTDWEGCFR